MKKTFKVKGMHCNSCSQLIEDKLKYKEGIGSVSASYTKEEVEVDFNPKKISEKEIKEIIKKLGYEVEDNQSITSQEQRGKISESSKESEDNKISEENNINKNESAKSDKIGWFVLVGSLVLLAIVVYYFFLRGINLEIPGGGETGSIFLLFIVGLLTGFHCVSMCGYS